MLLTGSRRAFSAGGDFNRFPTLQDPQKLEHLRRDAKQLIWDLLEVELPIVCALNGPAAGLGASIALLTDTIFMAESAMILDPHVRVGIVAGDGGTVIWPMAVGPARVVLLGCKSLIRFRENDRMDRHFEPGRGYVDASCGPSNALRDAWTARG